MRDFFDCIFCLLSSICLSSWRTEFLSHEKCHAFSPYADRSAGSALISLRWNLWRKAAVYQVVLPLFLLGTSGSSGIHPQIGSIDEQYLLLRMGVLVAGLLFVSGNLSGVLCPLCRARSRHGSPFVHAVCSVGGVPRLDISVATAFEPDPPPKRSGCGRCGAAVAAVEPSEPVSPDCGRRGGPAAGVGFPRAVDRPGRPMRDLSRIVWRS